MTRARDVADSALVHIHTETFSAVSSASINDVFSTTYNNYKIIIALTNTTTSGFINLRLRVGGSDVSSANYSQEYYGVSGTHTIDAGGTSASISTYLGYSKGSEEYASSFVEIANPFLSVPTLVQSLAIYKSGSNFFQIINTGGGLDTTTSYTGFTILMPAGANATGTVSVYGYRN